MAEELARKRRQCAGHRSSAKLIIPSVIDVLEGGDICQVWENTKSRWNNTDEKDSLQKKLTTLRQLDTEIHALVAEDDDDDDDDDDDTFIKVSKL